MDSTVKATKTSRAQVQYMLLICAFPGLPVNDLAEERTARWGENHSPKSTYVTLAGMMDKGLISRGPNTRGRGQGHYLTDAGKANMPVGEVPPRLEGSAAVEAPRTPAPSFTIAMAAEESRAASGRLPSSPVASYTDPNGGKQRGDLGLYNIRLAIQQARSIHEKICETRGGPAVMVDARFAALIRAVDLLVDKMYGAAK